MAGKPYKPNRPVTSDKIRQVIQQAYDDKYPDRSKRHYTQEHSWKRVFRKKLPDSRNNVRGYIYPGLLKMGAVAISSEDDTELLKVYIVEDAQREFQSLGVLEIILAE